MARSVAIWVGKSDDHRAPKSVRDRIFDRHHGKCHLCCLPIQADKGQWALDHVIALIAGGRNAEDNLAPAHIRCNAEKAKAEVAEKAKVAAIRQKHRRIVDVPKMRGAPFPTSTKAANRQRKPSYPPRALYASRSLWPASHNPQVREGE